MPYRYLDDIAIADVAFEAWGKTLEEMFSAAADALMNVMVADLGSIRQDEKVAFSLENAELDLLLFNFLNELIYFKDARRLLLRIEALTIERDDSGNFTLQGRAGGEVLDPDRHSQLVDVKAVTLHRFRVEETPQGWEATVVLDI
ncbi:MAG: archease [Geobacteraceae bacterium]|nr:archease [Geobacteraceae bacterium]